MRHELAYKSPSLTNSLAAQMTTTASTLTAIPQGDMYVTQCVQLGATLDVRFMIDFQPEEALEPRVLYVVAEQVSDASRCAKGLLTMAVYSLTGSASSHFRLTKIPGAHAMQGLCLRRRPVMSQLTAAVLVAPPVSVLQPHD